MPREKSKAFSHLQVRRLVRLGNHKFIVQLTNDPGKYKTDERKLLEGCETSVYFVTPRDLARLKSSPMLNWTAVLWDPERTVGILATYCIVTAL